MGEAGPTQGTPGVPCAAEVGIARTRSERFAPASTTSFSGRAGVLSAIARARAVVRARVYSDMRAGMHPLARVQTRVQSVRSKPAWSGRRGFCHRSMSAGRHTPAAHAGGVRAAGWRQRERETPVTGWRGESRALGEFNGLVRPQDDVPALHRRNDGRGNLPTNAHTQKRPILPSPFPSPSPFHCLSGCLSVWLACWLSASRAAIHPSLPLPPQHKRTLHTSYSTQNPQASDRAEERHACTSLGCWAGHMLMAAQLARAHEKRAFRLRSWDKAFGGASSAACHRMDAPSQRAREFAFGTKGGPEHITARIDGAAWLMRIQNSDLKF